MNYYDLFGFEMSPVIDKTQVARKYFELQKKFHPDFYSNSLEFEKENALDTSAEINKAFQIFKDEDKTLEYFLKENNVVVSDEKYTLPNDFLMEMLDLNDAVMELEPKEVENKIDLLLKTLDEELSPILNKDFKKGFTVAEMEALKMYHYKKKYLHRILDRLNQ